MADVLLIAGFILYIKFGRVIGLASWRAWFEDERTGVVSFILFPYSYTMNEIGGSSGSSAIVSRCSSDGAERAYIALVTVMWPLKLAWNAVAISLMGAIYVIAKAVEVIIALSVRRRLRTLPATPPTRHAAPYVQPPPSKTPEEELVQLMVERKRITRRIRELQLQLTQKHGSGKFRISKRNEEN